jgi:hypothetical protein
MSINIVFQEKGKNNIIIKSKAQTPFSELIQSYYKNICASKKDKMTKLFVIKGTEHSPEESTVLSELGLRDYSVIDIQSTEKAVTETTGPKKKEQPQEEQPQEEQPQEEPPQEEPPQEENNDDE